DIIPGISVLVLPGHSSGLQGIVVDTESGGYVITGDLVPLWENWSSVPKIPNGSLEDLDTILKSYAKLEEKIGNRKILPGHDPKVFDQEIYQ
ncbi:MAG: N-acyl homoserine lactonase family protein, partial [Clostridiales Family XIII bacterium]|nr:N-acyl homoserine lactonase family protein [Clostridiales Family XIII bacterium]